MVTAPPRPTGRRRLIVGLVIGALAGAAIGAAMLTGAVPAVSGPRPYIIHGGPTVVRPGRDVVLFATSFCPRPAVPSCRLRSGEALVHPVGAGGWTSVPGRAAGGGFRFVVPAGLVPSDGFSYWLRFRPGAGPPVAYPPGGPRSPIRVVTISGLPHRRLETADPWDDVEPPDGAVLALPWGDEDGAAGHVEGQGDRAPAGPSSFAIDGSGSLYVVDWVNDRIERFGRDGRFVRSFGLPEHAPMDIAISDDGRIYLTTLGMNAAVYELAADGAVRGRYPVAYGLPSRIAAAPDGPRILVDQGQWSMVRGAAGRALSPEAQLLTGSAATPRPDGRIGFSTQVGGRAFAAVWTRPNGTRAGALVHLPAGVLPGVDYLVQPLGDGGALVAKGLYDDTHSVVGVFRFDAVGRVRALHMLPEPSVEQAAYASTIRFQPPSSVIGVYDGPHGVRYDRFEVI
jgi:hypothetical protein